MNKDEFMQFVNNLELLKGHYLVFGGGCLTIRRLRECGDLDLFVSAQQYVLLRNRGWQETNWRSKSPYLVTKINGVDIQAFKVWEMDGWQPDFPKYLSEPEMVEGLPFMPLRELYDWKAATRRPKDIKDLVLIETYWK